MARSALILGAAASLGLGVLDLGLLNLHLVPAALSASSGDEVVVAEAPAPRPDAPGPARDDLRAERPAAITADERAAELEPTEPTAERGQALPDLVTLRFDSDSDELSERALRRIEDLADRLDDDASLHLLVTGHADERGTAEYNDALALGRARSVAAALVRAGIARDRIEERSLGETRPLTEGRDPASLHKNRRVEIAMKRGQP